MIVGMKKALGVNIIIRNRPGAGGKIAWDLTWGAKPDGYTISTVNIPGAIISELFDDAKPQYRLKEFSWIGQISTAPYIWAVGAKTPFKSLKDVQQAKEVLLTGTGVSTTGWVADLLTATLMKFNHRFILGYPSAPASNIAIVKGEGHGRVLTLDSPGQMAFINDGSMRPMWVYLEKRHPDFPDVPTVGEARRLHHLHRQYPGRHHLGAVRRRQTAVSVEGVGPSVADGACGPPGGNGPPGDAQGPAGQAPGRRRSTPLPGTRTCWNGSRR